MEGRFDVSRQKPLTVLISKWLYQAGGQRDYWINVNQRLILSQCNQRPISLRNCWKRNSRPHNWKIKRVFYMRRWKAGRLWRNKVGLALFGSNNNKYSAVGPNKDLPDPSSTAPLRILLMRHSPTRQKYRRSRTGISRSKTLWCRLLYLQKKTYQGKCCFSEFADCSAMKRGRFVTVVKRVQESVVTPTVLWKKFLSAFQTLSIPIPNTASK